MPATQGVPQIRAQVNISQQQRIAAALVTATANARLSPQQLQVQGRAVGQGAQGQGQVAAVGTAGTNSSGGSPRGYYVGGMTAEQLSRLQMLVSENKV